MLYWIDYNYFVKKCNNHLECRKDQVFYFLTYQLYYLYSYFIIIIEIFFYKSVKG